MCPFCLTEPNPTDPRICLTQLEAKRCAWWEGERDRQIQAMKREGFSYSEAARRADLFLEQKSEQR